MKKILLVVLVCIVLGGFVALIYTYVRSPASTTTVPAETASTSTPTLTGREVPPGFVEYARQNYHFSILLPESVTVKEEGGTNGKPLTVVVQDPSTGNGFQIYAFPYNLPTITQQRFKIDEPSGVVKNQQNVSVAGAKGTMFEGFDPSVGPLREIWFINKGILYEVTTALTFDEWIRTIMGTWQFVE